MTMRERQRQVQLYRGQIPSPGRPTVAWREDRVRFWAAIGRGASSEDAACEIGVSPAVGTRWFRQAGGVAPNLPPAVSGRYLSFAEREDIAIWHAQKAGVREIARRLGRSPSTISRELRRNASTRTWRLDYRASVAQWHAERRARRPKVSKLAANERLREYVQDRLAGAIRRPDGMPVPGPAARFSGRRHGPRQDRRWAACWSPEQIASRLPADFPDDESMRVSHEAIYQALYIQGRGALRASWSPACAPAGRCGCRAPGPAAPRRHGHSRGDDQRAARRSWRPGRPRSLGGRPDHRPEQLRDRHAGRADHPVHDAAAPAPHGRLRHPPRVKNGPPLAGHGAEAVRDAIAATITTLPGQLRRSLTWDRGKEMAQHAQLRIDTGLQVYFADPHSPWQRGTNENTNGLLRQYFPKGTDLARWTPDELDAVAAALNTRPRKTLGWKTPAEALNEQLLSAQQAGVATTG